MAPTPLYTRSPPPPFTVMVVVAKAVRCAEPAAVSDIGSSMAAARTTSLFIPFSHRRCRLCPAIIQQTAIVPETVILPAKPVLRERCQPWTRSARPHPVQVLQGELVQPLECHAAGGQCLDVGGEPLDVRPGVPRGQGGLGQLADP